MPPNGSFDPAGNRSSTRFAHLDSFSAHAAARTDIAHLVALVDSLLAPAPVGEQFATARGRKWVAEFDQWTALVRERIDLRARLTGYDEPKLLALDLDMLSQKWQAAQKRGFSQNG